MSRRHVRSGRWMIIVLLALIVGLLYKVLRHEEGISWTTTHRIPQRLTIKQILPTIVPVTPRLVRYMSTKQIFEDYFPQCLPSPRLMETDHDLGSLPEQWLHWFNRTTSTEHRQSTALLFQYIPSETLPRYDHITCPVMKARYNCARSSLGTNRHGSMNVNETAASDYKFVWRQHVSNGSWCDLQALTDFIQGPASVPQRNILLQGNSYLRQIWEAIVCGFPSQITNLTLLSHGRPTSLAYIASRSGKLLQKQELGNFLINQQYETSGCHAPHRPAELATYYHEHVTVPPNLEFCSDDMAMVEFNHGLRIFFLFHPSRFHIDALMDAYSLLDVPDSIDVLVWMDPSEHEVKNRTTRATWSLEDRLLPSLRRVQEASIGYFYGADNPWITHPPDNHPCLPGIPDDEANILIYLLLLEDYERTSHAAKEQPSRGGGP